MTPGFRNMMGTGLEVVYQPVTLVDIATGQVSLANSTTMLDEKRIQDVSNELSSILVGGPVFGAHLLSNEPVAVTQQLMIQP
jgi:hypothetical protein